MRKVLDDLALAERILQQEQMKADHLCAGVLAGAVPEGSQVVAVDVEKSLVTVFVALGEKDAEPGEDDAAAA